MPHPTAGVASSTTTTTRQRLPGAQEVKQTQARADQEPQACEAAEIQEAAKAGKGPLRSDRAYRIAGTTTFSELHPPRAMTAERSKDVSCLAWFIEPRAPILPREGRQAASRHADRECTNRQLKHVKTIKQTV